MKISFEIVSRGKMVVSVNEKTVQLDGELTFEPPVFYVTLPNQLFWDKPYSSEAVTTEEIAEIKNHLETKSVGTKIVFD